jgi:hypothetical protein
MVIAYTERSAVILDLETNAAALPLVDRMLGLQETTLPERVRMASLALAFARATARASGIVVAVVAPL